MLLFKGNNKDKLGQHRKKKLLISFLLLLLVTVLFSAFLSFAEVVQAESLNNEQSEKPEQSPEPINIYFFWGEGCPHCATAKPILQSLADQNPQVNLYLFEVYYDTTGQQAFFEMAAAYNFEPRYVPTIMIADRYWEGFSDQIQADIESQIAACLNQPCTDLGSAVAGKYIPVEPTQEIIEPTVLPPTLPPTQVETPSQTQTPLSTPNSGFQSTITIPLIGSFDLSTQSLFLSTLLIAIIDGFNPCSIWVLTMLLSITLHSGSRKKILIVGLVFISVTALIYALFIAGLFTVFSVISFVGWIQIVVALVALFFGLVNIKDYFWYKEGLSFTIDEKSKPGLYKKMRRILDAGDSLWGLIGGTIVLAAGVSLVEFSCTAGFPVLWTNLLTSQQVTTLTFVILLLVYMLVYQLDELGIFLVSVFTLKSNKIEEKHGRILKLTGGMLMITLAGVMLINPSLMSNIQASLIIFAIAFVATALVLVLHRLILPRLGVHIGTEPAGKSNKHKSKEKHALQKKYKK